jgi:REP element-mobilizing transposase RayT
MDTSHLEQPPALKHTVRYLEKGTVYHICSQTLNNEFLLVPNDTIHEIVSGVLGWAQEKFPDVSLFAYVFMSNHFHMMAEGPPADLSRFVGFVKREISRRMGSHYKIRGPKWERRFEASALLDEDSVLQSLEYILAHGVKEDLVESPLEWPGIHCAEHLLSGEQRKGRRLDGTRYGKALFSAKERRKSPPKKDEYWKPTQIVLSALPLAFLDCKKSERDFVLALIRKIEESHAARRKTSGLRVKGRNYVLRQHRKTRKVPPALPWYERRRRRLTAWISPKNAKCRAYEKRYWTFQNLYRKAADALRAGTKNVLFPPGAWTPSKAPI